ncbi:MAG: FtsX-like permease family protein [Ruminococcaceae bacterium]|nr:FtsX-like permease family protein [Oscillospiraceae bacterium]
MNIMNRLTWKSMVKNRTRTIVTTIGIALSAALFCAVTTMGASILSYLIDLQIAVGGDYHVSAVTLTQEEADTIRNREDVASFAETQTLGMVNFYVEEMGFNSGLVKACNEAYFENMPTVLKEGRLPQNSGEFVIGEYLLHNMEAKGYPTAIGSEVTLTVTPYVASMKQGDPEAPTFTITGTIVGIHDMNSSVVAPGEGGGYSYIFTGLDENTPNSLYCDLFLKAESPLKAKDLAAAVKGSANYSLLQYYGIVEAGNVAFVIPGIMAAIIAIVMVGTIGLISNAFSVSVAQRTQEFGLLSSVGATKKQLRRSVHFEAGMLCLMGIPLGILLGFGAVVVLLHTAGDTVESMVATMQSGVQIKAVANPVALLGAAGIAAATVFLSSWIPSVKAARITPISAIRQESEYQADKKLTKTARKWWKPGKVSANMAAKYYRTNRKKYRPIVTALSISVVLFLSAMAVSSSLQFISDSIELDNFDFIVFIHNGDEALLNEIRNHESVAQSVLYDNERIYTLITDEYESEQRKDAFDTEDPVDKDVAITWKTNAASVYYLEDDAFRAYLQEQGVDPDPYFDKDNPLATVFYQQWQYVGMTEIGYNWISFTFPPLDDAVTELPVLPDAPNVDDYVTAQIKAQGHQEAIVMPEGFDVLPDGRIVYRVGAQGCTLKPHESGVYEIIAEGPEQIFTFLAVEEAIEENHVVIRYYTYDEETGSVGNTVIAETAGSANSVRIGAQLNGIPFGISNDASSAMHLSLLMPLSMREDSYGRSALSLRSNNYPATKAFLDSLAQDDSVMVYNDYLAEQYQMRQVSNLVNLFAVVFVVIMTLISVANIFNVVSTNILLRRRDLDMLQSLGMTRRGIAAMTAREYLSCGIRALCWSLPIGVLLMLGIKILLGNLINGGNEIPWWAVLAATASVFLVVGSSMLYALIRIQKDNPIDAIRMENT